MLTVCPADLCVMPVSLTMRAPEVETSSRRSAVPSFSSLKESMSAMGLQPVDCGRRLVMGGGEMGRGKG